MPVFKCFFYIIYRNKLNLSIYFFIFLGIMIASMTSAKEENVFEFSTEKIKIGVVDRDNTEASKALSDYLKRECEVVPTKDKKEDIQDQMFFRELEYVAYIPDGFQESMQEGKTPEIENIKIPDSYTGSFIDMKINSYVNLLNVYLKNGSDLGTSIYRADTVSDEETKVSLLDGSTASMKPKYYYYFTYYSYIVTILIIFGVASAFMQFNKKVIRRRMAVSSQPISSANVQLIGASLVLSIALWIVLFVFGLIICGNSADMIEKLPYLLVTSFAYTMVSASLGFLASHIVKGSSGLNGVGNVFSLGFAFLGGVFVPLEMMGEGILKVAQFTPSYWYVNTLECITVEDMAEAATRSSYWNGVLLQFVFALCFFCVALLLRKVRTKENS